MGQRAVLVDLSKCVGCRGCQVACKQWHDLPAVETTNTGSYQNPPRRDSNTLMLIEFKEFDRGGKVDWTFVKRQCMHCLEPACVSACTVKALLRREDGAIVYDDKRCIGCRYCMYACPFGIPTFQWDEQLALVSKCDFCVDRQDQGMEPACVQTCVAGALRYGTREEMLDLAHQTIHAPDSEYVKHVYGEFEAGGTSWLYISRVPFADLGMPDVSTTSPARASQSTMHATPAVAVGMAICLTGLHTLLERREQRLHPTINQEKADDRSHH